ncbi:hypothetical protein E4T56_gene5290 [Termitomyces sp. T112]|nr:hypothetical protein E4T56_gene5290 [Termitomyces sp. T112]
MLTFLMERAQKGNLRYVIGGASALKLHGVINRTTEDVDFYIPPKMTLEFAHMLFPHLNQFREERMIFPGLEDRWTDPRSVERATKMTVFYHYDLNLPIIVKADISESPGLLEGDRKFVVDLKEGLHVASVPVLAIFKLCAICRGSRKGQPGRLKKDIDDLVRCLDYLVRKNPQPIPSEVRDILKEPDEHFAWGTLWKVLGENAPGHQGYIKATLVELGFSKTDVSGS